MSLLAPKEMNARNGLGITRDPPLYCAHTVCGVEWFPLTHLGVSYRRGVSIHLETLADVGELVMDVIRALEVPKHSRVTDRERDLPIHAPRRVTHHHHHHHHHQHHGADTKR